MKTLQEQRTESVLNMQERITELEKENAELKGLVNQYKASKCSGISLANRNMIMSDQLTKSKELLKKWLQTSKASSCDNINIVTDTEQFLSEEGKNDSKF